MHPEDIKAEIRKAVGTIDSLTKIIGVQNQTIYNVIAGRRRSRKTEQCISEAINRPLNEIWPQYYES